MISEKFHKYELLRILNNLEFQIIYHNEKAQGTPSFDGPFPAWKCYSSGDYWDFDIKINDYLIDRLIDNFDNSNYLTYINSFSENFRDELNQTKSIIESKPEYLKHLFDILDHLEHLKTFCFILRLEEWDPYGIDIAHMDVQYNRNVTIIPNDPEKYTNDNFLKYCISRFILDYNTALEATINTVRNVIEREEKTNDLAFGKKGPVNRNLFWNKNDTDLLELITSLVETRSITNIKGNLTRKEAIDFFKELFNLPIKDAESKLTRATSRKKDISPYLTSLKEAFDNYAIKKEDKLNEIRG